MAFRFVGLVGSLPPDEQQIWLPNQLVHDLRDLGCPASAPAKIGVRGPLEQTQLQGTGNVHSARPASSSF